MSRNSFPLALILSFTVLLLVSSCSDSGSIGGVGGGSGTDINIDTVEVSAFDTEMLNAYTGRKAYFSAGQFQDPLFGDVSAMGLFKPQLGSNGDTLSFDADTEMILRLAINGETTYGDSLANMTFNLVEITENWRGPAWRLDDEIGLSSGDPVASFTVADEDTLEIPLADTWVQKYGKFFNSTDSTRTDDYIDQLYGLALVPQNSGRIITINPDSTEIQINNVNVSTGGDDDTLSVGLADAAFSVDRSNEADIEGSTKIYSTLERVIKFDFDFSFDDITLANVARAEFVFYRDEASYDQGLEENVVRPDVSDTTALTMHLIEGDELPQSLDPGSPLTQNSTFIYSRDDNAYHLNVTSLIRQDFFSLTDQSLQLYLKMAGNNGVIRSDILFNDQSAGKAPKLIITSTNNR